eukprot:scaffold707_cov111-Alexandrium_tamarense.AAC.4
MGNAESSGINVNRWGGRTNRTATMCATRKLLLWEYARLTRKTTATFKYILHDIAEIWNAKVSL